MSVPLPESLPQARALVLEYGRCSTAYQILNRGFELWLSGNRDAVVGYVARHNVRVAGRNPVCSPSSLRDVVDEFTTAAHHNGDTVAFFCADAHIAEIIGDSGEVVAIGSEPSWVPGNWESIVRSKASLRAQIHRAENKGVAVTELEDRSRAAELLGQCLDEWLETRPMPPLHFHGLMTTLSRENCRTVSFGLAPLSRKAWSGPPNPLWLRIVFAILFTAGAPFYNFRGLEAFKSKLQPDRWETIYLACPDTAVSMHTFLAIASAFAEQPLGGLVVGTLGRKRVWG